MMCGCMTREKWTLVVPGALHAYSRVHRCAGSIAEVKLAVVVHTFQVGL